MKTSAITLGEVAAKAALAAGNVNPEIVDHSVFGHVLTVIIYYPKYSHLLIKTNATTEVVQSCNHVDFVTETTIPSTFFVVVQGVPEFSLF